MVLIASGEELMLMVRLAVAVWGVLSESLTSTVKLVAPAVVGVPEIMPVGDSAVPAGRLPELTLHV